MCGIAGALVRADAPDPSGLVEAIVESQRARGPDHQAVERVEGRRVAAILGHDRLSIIDLSNAANQPLWDRTGRYGLVFNGEIYNYVELREELSARGHRFTTESDSEVILEAFKAWGPEAVPRFNGMFAFALYDRAEETLFLFRDRFGVKPLYYHRGAHALFFASTPGELARRLRLAPDLIYAARGLRYWVYEADDERTPYEGLVALPPGTGLKVGPDLAVTPWRYYDLESRVALATEAIAGYSERQLVAIVADQLDDAVRLRLRADVPLGVSLSGGLDSSSVAALVTRRHDETIGFTFGHPGARGSEGPQVARLAKHAGIEVEYVWPEPKQVVDAFWKTLAAQGAPFPSGSLVAQFLVFEAVKHRGIKVLLGGQGGDEAFCGYHKYQVIRLRRLLREGPRGEALGAAAAMLPLLLSELRGLGPYMRALRRYMPGGAVPSALRLPEPPPFELGGGLDRQALDITRFSLPTLLRYEDRNSLGNGVESRLPYLDYRLVELGLALPEGLKLRGGYGKWVMREAVGAKVPGEIRWARFKRGFDVPLGRWVSAGLGESLRARLHQLPVAQHLAPGASIDVAFSDARLAGRSPAFAEAVTLAWLGGLL